MGFLNEIQDRLLPIIQSINNYLGDYLIIVILLGVGIFFTIKTKFVQVRCLGEGFHNMFGDLSLKKKDQNTKGFSSFRAFTTAVAAQIGTGNIVGACGAILLGGPGAIFWMWVISFFSLSIIYAEAVLALKTREIDEAGNIQGGPVYYIKRAFKGRFGKIIAGFFAVAAVLTLGLIGSMVQSNSISESFNQAFNVPAWLIGLILVVLCGIVYLGGTKRIGSVAEKIVPFMAVFYILGCLILLGIRIKNIPTSFFLIFKFAFNPQAILGGSIGFAIKTAISQGAKRGLFCNEAGMGSTPHAHAQANVDVAHKQGTVAMTGAFINSFIILTLTALVVLSVFYTKDTVMTPDVDKTKMAQIAFSSVFGEHIGSAFVALCLLFFGFSTILGWNLFGKINIIYLFGKKAVIPSSIIALAFTFMGACFSNKLVWELQDFVNQLMVIPNVLGLVALSTIVAIEAKKQEPLSDELTIKNNIEN